MAVQTDQTPPFVAGIEDIGDAPLGAENPAPIDPNQQQFDPVASEAQFRRAVITLLTEIRDALLADECD